MSPENKDAIGTPTRLKPPGAAAVAASSAPQQDPDPVDLADLKRKSVRGGTVTLVTQGITIGIQLTSTVVLARLLSPDDYGVMAMVMAIVSFAGLFRDLGLSSAAIQKKDLTNAQQSNLFWLNVAMGTLLTILVAAASPLVVMFYGKPELLWVTVALSFSFLIGSFGTQHGAMLVRNMQFGRNAVAGISGALVGLAVSITLAFQGWSYWSLVWGNLSGSLITTVLFFILSPFRPGLMVKGTGIRDMLKFGANVTAFDFVNYFNRNLDNILVGRVWGATALGVYSRAYSLLLMPINAIRSPIMAVAFPALSSLQSRPSDYRSYYRSILIALSSLSVPFMGFIILAAEPIVAIVLGERWAAVAPILRAMGVAGLIQPCVSTVGTISLSLGNGKRYFLLGTIHTIISVIGFGVGVLWGPIGVAVSYAISNAISAPILLIWSFKDTPISVKGFMTSIFPAFIMTLPSVIITIAFFPAVSGWSPAGRLSVIAVIYGVSLMMQLCLSKKLRKIVLGSTKMGCK